MSQQSPARRHVTAPCVEGLESRQLLSAVTSFTLINSQTDQPIRTLNNGDTINLADYPANRLNVRANTDNSGIKSVKFALDGNNNFNIEGSVPYALFGDTGTNYNNGTFSLGQHTLKATPFSGSSATGTAGTFKQITFNVVNQTTPPPDDNDVVPAIVRFALMNADTDTEIKTLTNGEHVDLATLPTRHLNVIAIPGGTTGTGGGSIPIKSVKFGYDANDNFNIEGTSPYSLFGDSGTNLNAGTLTIGSHTLRAQAFAGNNATGESGVSGQILFFVEDSSLVP
jgi:hypothetical protein